MSARTGVGSTLGASAGVDSACGIAFASAIIFTAGAELTSALASGRELGIQTEECITMAQASGVSVTAWELGIQAVECITLAQASGVVVTAWELGIQPVGSITLAQASGVLDTAWELGIHAEECVTLAQASGVLVEACRMARHDVAGGARTNKARRFANDKAEVSVEEAVVGSCRSVVGSVEGVRGSCRWELSLGAVVGSVEGAVVGSCRSAAMGSVEGARVGATLWERSRELSERRAASAASKRQPVVGRARAGALHRRRDRSDRTDGTILSVVRQAYISGEHLL